MARKDKKKEIEQQPLQDTARFKLTRTKIKEMYESDESVLRNVNKTKNVSSTINSLDIPTIESNYYAIASLDQPRQYAAELYTFNPVFANIVDYFCNMFSWKYVYIPRLVKEKGSATDYEEMYNLMGEVVDGLSIETTFPMILHELIINGAAFLMTTKNTSSKTITTISIPPKYCRLNAVTQFGTYTYQMDMQYFDSLGLSKDQLEIILDYYPKELRTMYNAYLTDKNNMRWQMVDPKYAAAIVMNKYGFPTKLNAIFGIKQYEDYLDNELERNGQLLDKIIAHKIPTWEDKLIIDIDEMSDLHKSLARLLANNEHTRLMTTFGDLDVLSIGEDDSKENKTLDNAYNSIYDTSGLNHNLFNANSVEALKYALKRDEAVVWKYIQQLMNFYNVTVNHSFNFKGYQCDIIMLPVTIYNQAEMIELYKNSATLGVSKIEYIISTGVKQIHIGAKIELEDFLHLDQLKPLSTSYTQNDNSVKSDTNNEDTDDEGDAAKKPEAADDENAEAPDDKKKQQEEQQEVKDNENTKQCSCIYSRCRSWRN